MECRVTKCDFSVLSIASLVNRGLENLFDRFRDYTKYPELIQNNSPESFMGRLCENRMSVLKILWETYILQRFCVCSAQHLKGMTLEIIWSDRLANPVCACFNYATELEKLPYFYLFMYLIFTALETVLCFFGIFSSFSVQTFMGRGLTPSVSSDWNEIWHSCSAGNYTRF